MTAQEIQDKYPGLYDRGVRCGFDCPEGWLELVDNLSGTIDWAVKNWTKKEVKVTVDQVKEKFGGLRFYVTYDYDHDDAESKEIVARLRGMIDFAEAHSFSVCQVCGRPGKRVSGGWIRTLCDKHAGFSTWDEKKKKGSVSLDFDGVIHSYTSGFVGIDKLPDPPVPGAIQYIQDLIDYGFKVYVYSTRNSHESARKAISQYLLDHGLPEAYHKKVSVVEGKPKAKIYLDDRAWEFSGKFPTPEEIHSFVPWTKRK